MEITFFGFYSAVNRSMLLQNSITGLAYEP